MRNTSVCRDISRRVSTRSGSPVLQSRRRVVNEYYYNVVDPRRTPSSRTDRPTSRTDRRESSSFRAAKYYNKSLPLLLYII